MNERLTNNHAVAQTVAEVAHEVNRAYCQALGDDSQTSWTDAPDWQKASAVDGVMFHQANPLSTPEDSHENWCREKVADGWVYGPVKDPAKKQHPCLLPYNELPVEQRAKDYIFSAVVREVTRVLRELTQ